MGNKPIQLKQQNSELDHSALSLRDILNLVKKEEQKKLLKKYNPDRRLSLRDILNLIQEQKSSKHDEISKIDFTSILDKNTEVAENSKSDYWENRKTSLNKSIKSQEIFTNEPILNLEKNKKSDDSAKLEQNITKNPTKLKDNLKEAKELVKQLEKKEILGECKNEEAIEVNNDNVIKQNNKNIQILEKDKIIKNTKENNNSILTNSQKNEKKDQPKIQQQLNNLKNVSKVTHILKSNIITKDSSIQKNSNNKITIQIKNSENKDIIINDSMKENKIENILLKSIDYKEDMSKCEVLSTEMINNSALTENKAQDKSDKKIENFNEVQGFLQTNQDLENKNQSKGLIMIKEESDNKTKLEMKNETKEMNSIKQKSKIEQNLAIENQTKELSVIKEEFKNETKLETKIEINAIKQDSKIELAVKKEESYNKTNLESKIEPEEMNVNQQDSKMDTKLETKNETKFSQLNLPKGESKSERIILDNENKVINELKVQDEIENENKKTQLKEFKVNEKIDKNESLNGFKDQNLPHEKKEIKEDYSNNNQEIRNSETNFPVKNLQPIIEFKSDKKIENKNTKVIDIPENFKFDLAENKKNESLQEEVNHKKNFKVNDKDINELTKGIATNEKITDNKEAIINEETKNNKNEQENEIAQKQNGQSDSSNNQLNNKILESKEEIPKIEPPRIRKIAKISQVMLSKIYDTNKNYKNFRDINSNSFTDSYFILNVVDPTKNEKFEETIFLSNIPLDVGKLCDAYNTNKRTTSSANPNEMMPQAGHQSISDKSPSLPPDMADKPITADNLDENQPNSSEMGENSCESNTGNAPIQPTKITQSIPNNLIEEDTIKKPRNIDAVNNPNKFRNRGIRSFVSYPNELDAPSNLIPAKKDLSEEDKNLIFASDFDCIPEKIFPCNDKANQSNPASNTQNPAKKIIINVTNPVEEKLDVSKDKSKPADIKIANQKQPEPNNQKKKEEKSKNNEKNQKAERDKKRKEAEANSKPVGSEKLNMKDFYRQVLMEKIAKEKNMSRQPSMSNVNLENITNNPKFNDVFKFVDKDPLATMSVDFPSLNARGSQNSQAEKFNKKSDKNLDLDYKSRKPGDVMNK